MNDIRTKYEECTRHLFSMTPSFQRVGAAAYKPGLQTMEDLAGRMGNPQDTQKIIHIAGTNGKGSVAHMMAASLAFAFPGKTVGLYTSPHLLDFRERIKAVSSEPFSNGSHFEEISMEEVVSFVDRYGDYISHVKPSFFEITTAMALDFFKKRNVAFTILETGLGGRLDSTNIVTPILSVITSIGLDHKEFLGDTISMIAAEKGGIIKKGIPVVTGKLPQDAMRVIEDMSNSMSAPLLKWEDCCTDEEAATVSSMHTDLHSDSVEINLRTVCGALKRIGFSSPFSRPEITEAISNTAFLTGLHGRWEKIMDKPTVICDIGHNPEALAVSMRQLARESEGKRTVIVYGMAADKDIGEAGKLLPENAEYIFTNASGSRAMPAEKLRETLGRPGGDIAETVEKAVEKALYTAKNEDYIYIGGSCFVVAEAIDFFQKREKEIKNIF